VWEGTANILALELIRLIRKFNAHTLFVGFIKERLDRVKDSSIWHHVVTNELEKLNDTLSIFASLDEEAQTIEAKEIAHRMALLYESLIAVETAKEIGGRYELLAEIYLENTWSLRKTGEPAKSRQLF
jgi:hypothetical protein